MSNIMADHELDTVGLYCPEPVMLLHNKIRDVNDNEVILVVASDPSTERDIPKFCKFLGHELVLHERQDSKYFYYIKKQSKD